MEKELSFIDELIKKGTVKIVEKLNDEDEDVMKAAKDYEAKKPEKYKIHKNSCNTATSSIIKDSGGNVKPKKSVPGWKK